MSTSGYFREAGLLLVLALIPALAAGWMHPHRPSWDPMVLLSDETSMAALAQQTEPALWVDARPRADYDKRHVPGALNLNEDDWDSQLPGVLHAWNPGQMVVVYCSSLECRSSRAVAERLREAGLSPVYSLKGGWESWLKANR